MYVLPRMTHLTLPYLTLPGKVYRGGVEVGEMTGANPAGLRSLVETHAGTPVKARDPA